METAQQSELDFSVSYQDVEFNEDSFSDRQKCGREDILYVRCDFSNAQLSTLTFDRCKFLGCDFGTGLIMDCAFRSCTFVKCNFSLATIVDMTTEFCTMSGCSFSDMQCMSDMVFLSTLVINTGFENKPSSRYDSIKFNKCSLNKCDFDDFDMEGVSFYNSTLRRTNIIGGSIFKTEFSRCNFIQTTIACLDINNAVFEKCVLKECFMEDVHLERTVRMVDVEFMDTFFGKGCKIARQSIETITISPTKSEPERKPGGVIAKTTPTPTQHGQQDKNVLPATDQYRNRAYRFMTEGV